MMKNIAAFVARHAGKERSKPFKILSLVLGFTGFFILVPLILGLVGHLVAKSFPVSVPRIVEVLLACAALAGGLFFLAWSVSTFWQVGHGTPVPFASPTRLVTEGPFKYTRNPLKLGAFLFYFGLGVLWDGFMTGLVILLIVVILGTLYHKSIEEKELAMRFGDAYERYRKRTSFLIPLPPRNK